MPLPHIPDPDRGPDDRVVRLVTVVLYAIFLGIAVFGLDVLMR